MHGGATPVALKAGKRRQQEAAAAKAVATFGLRRDVSAEDALLEELQWTAGHVAWLRDQVQLLEADALVWGVSSEVETQASQFPGMDTTREAASSVWLTLYQRERTHLLAVAAAVLKAGVDERRVRLAERQGAQLAERGRAYIAGVIDALGLDERSAGPVMLRLFAEMLRGLAGGDTRAAVTA